MIPSLQYNLEGKIESPLSPYQPSSEIKELLSIAQLDAQAGDEILTRPFEEFNDMSLIQRANLDQKDWLGYSPSQSSDPDEAWMFTGTSSITRSQIISTAANLAEQVVYPGAFAQNDEDEEDEAAAQVMRLAIEYNCRRSGYEETFLYGVISGLVNPVSYFKVDYAKKYIEILEGTASEYKKIKVLDEMFSGFQHQLLPLDEVLLGNPYVFNMQAQPFVINRRRITMHEARSSHGDHSNFIQVRPGVVSIFNETDGLFYDADDAEQDGMVTECRFMYRGQDREFVVVNNVYLSNPNTEYLPMRHRRILTDGHTIPLYNIVKYGAEPIDAKRFAYYKSLASKLSNDKELVDRMRQNAVDAATFGTFPSIFTMGAGKLDKSVFIPATTQEIGKDAKIQPATGMMNPQYAYEAARMAEQDIYNAGVDPRTSGVRQGPETARGAIILQQNAIRNLGVIGKMIAFGLVKPVGELMADDIVRYQTVGETMQLEGGGLGMKYQNMILNDKVIDGQKKTVVVKFTDEWANINLSKEDIRYKEVKMLEDAGDNKVIYESNPAVWSKRKFLIVIEADAFRPKNDAFDRTFKIEVYDRAINNPLIAQDLEKLGDVTRDFLFEPTVKGDSAKYIPRDTKKVMQSIGAPTQALDKSQNPNVVNKTVQQGAMAGAGNLSMLQ